MSLFTSAANVEPAKAGDRSSFVDEKPRSTGPSVEELDALELPHHGILADGGKLEVPSKVRVPSRASSLSTKTLKELEASDPTHNDNTSSNQLPSWSYPKMSKWRVLAACLTYFGNGLNDSAPGALIPYLETDYNVSYAIVSLIFVTNAVGFISAAFCTDRIFGRLGRARALMSAEVMYIIGCIMVACSPPFAVVVVAYFFIGFGEALNLALNNVYCANLANASVILGAAHGSYGIGGILGPIVTTSIASKGLPWSRFFLVLVAVRAVCLVFAGWASWNYEKEGTAQFSNSLQPTASHPESVDIDKSSNWKKLTRALSNRVTLVGTLFIFAYQGAEVSVSGWFITFLIDYRGGNPAHVGYVTSGFWGGITVGRFLLTHAAHRVGEKFFVAGLTAGVIVFQVLSWLVPNIIGDAVAISIVGLLLGPVYPVSQTVFTRLLPSSIQTVATGFIISGGSSGGAVVPFLTGAVAQAAGTFVLHPICIGFYVVMLGSWAALPRMRRWKA